jgi:hypothetical protein
MENTNFYYCRNPAAAGPSISVVGDTFRIIIRGPLDILRQSNLPLSKEKLNSEIQREAEDKESKETDYDDTMTYIQRGLIGLNLG